ncbi:hypothetical protein CIRG_09543 [Coccidioides immitis RMSCC 2394]|uniref:Uncharacterized protein n=1 Tax=Coccidioides immitis RMSCC 2394 TaxID=404692 RepID=A0A0J6YQY5_COCIT|nr:hypothetical protein CIRG_09543 [Coccidioides immitis RMSCC 2394]
MDRIDQPERSGLGFHFRAALSPSRRIGLSRYGVYGSRFLRVCVTHNLGRIQVIVEFMQDSGSSDNGRRQQPGVPFRVRNCRNGVILCIDTCGLCIQNEFPLFSHAVRTRNCSRIGHNKLLAKYSDPDVQLHDSSGGIRRISNFPPVWIGSLGPLPSGVSMPQNNSEAVSFIPKAEELQSYLPCERVVEILAAELWQIVSFKITAECDKPRRQRFESVFTAPSRRLFTPSSRLRGLFFHRSQSSNMCCAALSLIQPNVQGTLVLR